MKSKPIAIFSYLNYAGAFLMLLSIIFPWLEFREGHELASVSVNEWNIWIKRISVGLIGIAGLFITYILTSKKSFSPSAVRKYRFLMILVGAAALILIATAYERGDYAGLVHYGTGYFFALTGGCLYTASSIVLFFLFRKYI